MRSRRLFPSDLILEYASEIELKIYKLADGKVAVSYSIEGTLGDDPFVDEDTGEVLTGMDPGEEAMKFVQAMLASGKGGSL